MAHPHVGHFILNGKDAKPVLKVLPIGVKNLIEINGTNFDIANCEFIVICAGVSCFGFTIESAKSCETKIVGHFKAMGFALPGSQVTVEVFVFNEFGQGQNQFVKIQL